ncbi:MAG: hypothetical protein J6K04_08470 [Lachnospiraceae bacterium]|nr:hypothetical protein [Lachnospiraceae bacterium]
MITKKFSRYTKHQRIALVWIDIMQILISLLAITFILVAMFVTQDTLNIWTFIIGLAGIISLAEIIVRKTIKKQSYLYGIFLNIYKNRNPFLSPTQKQKEICMFIEQNIPENKKALIYGIANSGKTSAVFMSLFKYKKDQYLLQQLTCPESVIYIDCKSNKEEIVDFFCKFNMQNNEILIIDNIETMGNSFIRGILQTISNATGNFILIADTKQLEGNNISDFGFTYLLDDSTALTEQNKYSFEQFYNKMIDDEKKVFIVIFYIALSVTLVPIEDIAVIFDYEFTMHRLKQILKSLLDYGLVKYFPFNHEYLILLNRIQIYTGQKTFWDTSQQEIALSLLEKSQKYPESIWFGLVHLPYDKIVNLNKEKKEEIFNKALKCGNYLTLYNFLQAELNYNPNKEGLFLYESGTLYFYNNKQERAFEYFNSLVNNTIDDNEKNVLMLHLIEATHGDVSFSTIQNIQKYIAILSASDNIFSLYAAYWKLHIDSEKGILCLESYEILLNSLLESSPAVAHSRVHAELIKRCYTDIIRIHHILNLMPSTRLTENFSCFMVRNYDEKMQRYYDELYVHANTLHYLTLMDNILKNQSCEETFSDAVIHYNNAVKYGWENQKSVSASELKRIDLLLFAEHSLDEYDDYKLTIEKFLTNAEINKVSLHVAYCKTLLAKLCMVKTLNDSKSYLSTNKKNKLSKIQTYLRESKKIYRSFSNDYGVFRIDFLDLIYQFAQATQKDERESRLNKIADILEGHQEYQREEAILKFLRSKLEQNEYVHMNIHAIIKAYPIIMQ